MKPKPDPSQNTKRYKLLKQEADLGKRIAVRVLKKYPRHNDAKANSYLSSLGRAVASRIGRQEIYFYFAILKSNESKSFAIPGGFVFLTTGLLKSVKNEAALVGILSREIAMVNEKALFKKIKGQKNRNEAANNALAILLKDKLPLKIKNQIESEAMYAMVTMGYDPSLYVPVSKNKKLAQKVSSKLKVKVTNSNANRFKQLKARI